jgi:hypothetical protein
MGERVDAGALRLLLNQTEDLAQHVARLGNAVEIGCWSAVARAFTAFLASARQPRGIDDTHSSLPRRSEN